MKSYWIEYKQITVQTVVVTANSKKEALQILRNGRSSDIYPISFEVEKSLYSTAKIIKKAEDDE